MAKKKDTALTPQQATFVAEYLVHLNGKRAAIAAGYSKKTAEVQASRLLRIAKVAEAVKRGQAERAERLKLDGDAVVLELGRIASVDIAAAYNESGTFKDIHTIPVDVRRAISAVETEELFDMVDGERVFTGYLKKVKFWGKVEALNLLGKHKGLYTDRVHHTGSLQHQHATEDLKDFTDEELAQLEAIYRARDERRRAAANAGGHSGGAGAAPEGG
ncbi:hypothetical protein [Myxococcus phage Mx4 ts27htf-1hrm-1]|nr:hypothetical protein [Myxococcus phage Mx4 ts27htf-1hrm-1]